MTIASGPRGTSSDLLLSVDPINIKSYPGSGSTLNNITGVGTVSLVSSPAFSPDGLGSFTLDGVNNYAYITNSVTTAELSPSIATMSLWVKPDKTGIIDYRGSSLISRGNYNTSGGFFIVMNSNSASTGDAPTVNAQFSYSTTTSYNFDSTSSYSLGGWSTWVNVTVCVDGAISLYINGALKETKTRTNAVNTIVYGSGTINTNGDTNLVICSSLSYGPTYNGGFWQPYKGKFSTFQMWNRRLGDSEVLQNYKSMKSRFGV